MGEAMRSCIAGVLLFCGSVCLAQSPSDGGRQYQAAYPESEAAAAWRGLAAGYVRRALKEQTLDKDPALNARVDAAMAAVAQR
jgi:hypothetical protein